MLFPPHLYKHTHILSCGSMTSYGTFRKAGWKHVSMKILLQWCFVLKISIHVICQTIFSSHFPLLNISIRILFAHFRQMPDSVNQRLSFYCKDRACLVSYSNHSFSFHKNNFSFVTWWCSSLRYSGYFFIILLNNLE